MDAINNFLQSLIPGSFDIQVYLTAALVILVAFLLLGIVGRLLFGKKSILNRAISSAISILFIYVFTVAVYSFGVDLAFLISPLPFIGIQNETLSIFVFEGVHYTIICNQILSMVILAFLANLADSWLPTGKKVLSWFFFRILSVLLAMVLHLIANAIITVLLPDGLLTWAPVVLLGLLAIFLAVGLLKVLIGTVLSVAVHPFIGILYTFFFANVVGKQVSKAVLTAGLLTGLIYLLNYFQVTMLVIASSALIAYIPLLIILLVVWYFVGRLL